MSSLRILIFTGAFSSGGAEKQSILLAKVLNKKYNCVIVSYYGEKQLIRYINLLESENIKYYQLKGNFLEKLKKFYQLYKTEKPDILFNFLPSNNLLGGIIGNLNNTSIIFGGIRNSRVKLHQFIELFISHNFLSDYSIYNNESGIKYFSKLGFKQKKSLFIPNCLYPLPEKKGFSKRSNSNIVILMVSRFEKQKDHFTAIEAFNKIIEKHNNVQIDLIGIGKLEDKIRKMVRDFNLSNKINIMVNPENLLNYYEKADIFVQTSLFEGISNSILEAMSFSLPIVATNVGDNNKLVKPGINGYLTSAKDYNNIANNISDLINSPEKRQTMGNNSYNLLKSEFTIDKFENRYIELIEKFTN